MTTKVVPNTQLPTQAPKAILFDLDGTLLDTAADLGAALNHMLQQHQRPRLPTSSSGHWPRTEPTDCYNWVLVSIFTPINKVCGNSF